MNVYSVDERDAREEVTAHGYRVMILHSGRRVSAYNLDGADAREVFAWAEENSRDGAFSVASRFELDGGGVSLVWLTPPPEVVLESLED
ncbi:hypothetical protein [Microbacterium gilvum]|uniref:Uncharacterized protein n=1 Tax=Microbacterium gilvum TaxID=1336204 RepID=A0ABP9APH5_9MICO